jgi:glutamine---fructose-6-phosphate transaminase (isomerizing)
MCGIVGYVGPRAAAPLVLEALYRLEYRGYDSAGIAAVNGHTLTVEKSAGRIAVLHQRLNGNLPAGTTALAHTRWATHGAPNDVNAHPHTDCASGIAIVHNGIIENADVLRKRLAERGHTFRSETDTEVLAHLIEDVYDGSLADAVMAVLPSLEGTYGMAVVSAREPGTLVAARMGSPLLIGVGDGENFVASDAAAVVEHTRSVVYLDEGEVAVLHPDDYHIFNRQTLRIEKHVRTIDWDLGAVERGGYAHFMLKEIMEQPESIRNTVRGHLLEDEGTARFGGLNLPDTELLEIDRVVLTACGTSWHSALIGEYLLEEHARIPCEVEYASEFRYRKPIVDEDTLVIGISQSGETADTLAALREARQRGAHTLGIVNVVGSTIAREVDGGIYLHAGPEIGVASTKAFTSQVTALAMLALRIARLRGLSVLEGRRIVEAIHQLPAQVERVLASAGAVEAVAERFALKLKEISYIHAEGYPAAEMKHGPIALIDDMMPVIVVAPRDGTYAKIVSNVQEVKARGGRVIAVVTEGDEEITRLADHVFPIPATIDPLTPVLSVLPLQLFAYHIAVRRGCDVDKPRNLAKSVTVE